MEMKGHCMDRDNETSADHSVYSAGDPPKEFKSMNCWYCSFAFNRGLNTTRCQNSMVMNSNNSDILWKEDNFVILDIQHDCKFYKCITSSV